MSKTLGREPQIKTLIHERELDRIAGWVEEYSDLETGGDLFGFWTHTGAPVIQFVLGPGSRSRHNQTSFYQDKDYLIEAGEFLINQHGLQHIGEWHSHHQLGLAEPSGGDENTVFRALNRYDFPKFLLCIANLRPKSESSWNKEWTVNLGSFLFTHSRPNYQVGAWVVLPGESPIRSSLRGKWNGVSFKDPRLSRSWKVNETTLDTQKLEPTQPIEISEGLWYAKPDGLALLREIDTELKKKFKNCQMLRTASERIYFTFEEEQDIWRIELPDNFPQSSPCIQVNSKPPFQDKYWSTEELLVPVIISYLERYYRGEIR